MPAFNVRGHDCSPNCANCPCAKDGKPQKAVRAFGGTEGFCIVGEAPGSEEVAQGFPFIGPSGKIVNRILRSASIDRGRVWITNALLCRRPPNEIDFEKAIECCRPRLQADLQLAQPTAICALGATSMRALQLEVCFVSQARGTVQYSPLIPEIPVIGALHPAALLHGGAGEVKGGKQKMNVDAQAMFLSADVIKAYQVSQGIVPAQWSDDISIVHEPEKVHDALEAILADIYDWGILGLDLEWVCDGSKNALDALGAGAHRAQITLVGIGCAARSVSFVWETLVESGELDRLQQIMEDENLPKLAHNKQADQAVWEAQVGPIRGQILDTMLMHHAVCPGIDHDLQQVASQYLCIPPWKVDHKRQVEENKQRLKLEEKEKKALAKAEKKARKIKEHNERNAALHAEKERKKAECKRAKGLENELRRKSCDR